MARVGVVPDELREELGNVIAELVFCAQDVGFELAMLKCDKRENCPLVEKTRELITKVRELFMLQRKIGLRATPRRVPEYTA